MIELLNKKIMNMKFPTKEEKNEMDFFTLALYLQELNKLDKLYSYAINETNNNIIGDEND